MIDNASNPVIKKSEFFETHKEDLYTNRITLSLYTTVQICINQYESTDTLSYESVRLENEYPAPFFLEYLMKGSRYMFRCIRLNRMKLIDQM